MNPAGTRYSGVPNGVVIDSYSSKDYGGTGRNTGNLKSILNLLTDVMGTLDGLACHRLAVMKTVH